MGPSPAAAASSSGPGARTERWLPHGRRAGRAALSTAPPGAMRLRGGKKRAQRPDSAAGPARSITREKPPPPFCGRIHLRPALPLQARTPPRRAGAPGPGERGRSPADEETTAGRKEGARGGGRERRAKRKAPARGRRGAKLHCLAEALAIGPARSQSRGRTGKLAARSAPSAAGIAGPGKPIGAGPWSAAGPQLPIWRLSAPAE